MRILLEGMWCWATGACAAAGSLGAGAAVAPEADAIVGLAEGDTGRSTWAGRVLPGSAATARGGVEAADGAAGSTRERIAEVTAVA